jgi:hypothetical protein
VFVILIGVVTLSVATTIFLEGLKAGLLTSAAPSP